MKLFRALLVLLFAVSFLNSWGAVKTDKLKPLDSNGVEVYAFDGTQIGEWDNATSYVLQVLNGGLSIAGDANLQTSFTLDSQTITSVSIGAADNDTIATKGYIDDADEANSHHGGLTGLADDDHDQYALLTGRSGDTLEIEEVQALTSAGLSLNNAGGSSVLTLGAGGGQGATFAGGVIVSNMLTANNGGGDYDFTVKKNGGTTAFLYDAGLDLFTASTNFVFDTTGYIKAPVGTEAQRPGTPTKGMFRFNDDSGEFEGYDGTAWGEMGGAGGAGSPTTLQFIAADNEDTTDNIISGNNAAFNGGGTLVGTLSVDTTVKLVTGAASSFLWDADGNDASSDYFGVTRTDLTTIDKVKPKYFQAYYQTANIADDELSYNVAFYTSGDALIGTIQSLDLEAATGGKLARISAYIPDNASYAVHGFYNTSTATNATVNFDKFVIDDALGDITLYNRMHYSATVGNNGATATVVSQDSSLWIDSVTRDATGQITVSYAGLGLSTAPAVIAVPKGVDNNDTSVVYYSKTATSVQIAIMRNGSYYDTDFDIAIFAQEVDDKPTTGATVTDSEFEGQTYSIQQAQSSMTDISAEVEFNLGTATISNQGYGYVEAQDDSGNTRTKFTALKDCIVESINWSGVVSATGGRVQIFDKDGNIVNEGTRVGAVSWSHASASIRLAAGEFFTVGSVAALNSSADVAKLTFSVRPAASSLNVITPTQRVAYIKDVKSSGTDGGTFTSGSWQTRDLNTVSGDTSIVSLASNQFTLQEGTYIVDVRAPSYRSNESKLALYSITDSSFVDYGPNAIAADSAFFSGAVQMDSKLHTTVTITAATTYEVQHYGTRTQNTDGMGRNVGIAGVDEVYTTVKIIKVK